MVSPVKLAELQKVSNCLIEITVISNCGENTLKIK